MKKIDKWLIIFVMLTLLSCSKENINAQLLPYNAIILAFGDSITYGYGANKGEDYPALLATIIGRKVINAGISGERADQAKSRIAETLQKNKPQLVIVEIGGNDFLQRRSASDIKKDIKSIIKTIKEQHIPIVLVAVPDLSLMAIMANRPRDATLYKEIAEEEKIIFIPNVISNILRKNTLKSDQIHPNAKGYKQMAENIAKHLKDVGLW